MMQKNETTYDILADYVLSDPKESAGTDLLDHWAARVVNNSDYGFDKGLLGLGWLIAYLIQQGYVEGDADDILEDIDDAIYKWTLKEVLNPDVDVAQSLHYVTYYQQRLLYKSNAHFYRRFAHFECMKLLLEKLNKFLRESRLTTPAIIMEQVDVLLKYSYLAKTCVNERLIEEAFYTTVEKLIGFFEQSPDLSDYQLHLAKLYICVWQYEHPHWQRRIKEWLMPVTGGEQGWIMLANNLDQNKMEFIKYINSRKSEEIESFLFECISNIKSLEISHEDTIDKPCHSAVQ